MSNRRAAERALEQEQRRLERLASVPAFGGCDEVALRRIDGLSTEIVRRGGSVVQRAGTLARQAFVVLEGQVCEVGPGGHEHPLPSGHLVGAEVLASPAAVATSDVVASTDVRLLVFGVPELRTVADLLADRHAVEARHPARVGATRRRPVAVAPAFRAAGPAPSMA